MPAVHYTFVSRCERRRETIVEMSRCQDIGMLALMKREAR